MKDGKIDTESQKMLENLKNKLAQDVPKYNFIKLKVNWANIISEKCDINYLKDFGRKFEYKLIEIFDSAGFVKEETNSVWEEVNKHYLTMKTLLNKFDKNDFYIDKVSD